MHDWAKYALAEAAKSNIDKRQVGCIITATHLGVERIVGTGHNTEGKHAEINALARIAYKNASVKYKVYVTHAPCPECTMALVKSLGTDTEITVVEEFKKFDGDKTRYDLVPPSAIEGMAKVLTFGARKYGPNNWRKCEDADRYVAAVFRHVEAYRKGEKLDEESGQHHLEHAMTNLAFLLELAP